MLLTQQYPGCRAFITGAASGLGLALSRALATEQWTIGMADIHPEALEAAAQAVTEAGGTPIPVLLDVTDAAAFQQAAAAFVEEQGGIDLVVNNAGIAVAGDFTEIPLADWQAIVDINLMGVVHGCHAFLPYMKQASGGHILNIASAAAVAAGPFMTAYNATKAAVLALSETLYTELYDDDIHVSVAILTFFKTNIGKSQRGSEAHRQITNYLLNRSNLDADTVAAYLLQGMGENRLHLIYPKMARKIWHFKRLMPMRYLKKMINVGRATRRRIS